MAWRYMQPELDSQVYKRTMRLRGLISCGVLFAVLLAPVLGLAICMSPAGAAKVSCTHCAMAAGSPHRSAPASDPVAPCCRRNAPVPALSELSAQTIAPVQFALLAAASPDALFPALPVHSAEICATPPLLRSPISLLCTLRI